MRKIDTNVLSEMEVNTGSSIHDLSMSNGILLVFLRYFGCIFCKEAISDLSNLRQEIEKNGVRIVIVHMAEDKEAEQILTDRGLSNVAHISDPACKYYASFGLSKGKLTQLFGFSSFINSSRALSKGAKLPSSGENVYQMPGVFYIKNGSVVNKFYFKNVGDLPNYKSLCNIN